MCFSLFGFPNSGLVRQPDKLFTRTLKEDESLSSFLIYSVLILLFIFFFWCRCVFVHVRPFHFSSKRFSHLGRRACAVIFFDSSLRRITFGGNAVSDRGRPRSPYFLFHTLFFFLFLLRFLETLRQAASTNSSSSFSFFFDCV